MEYLFHTLPKILYFPVYVASLFGFAFAFVSLCRKLYLAKGKNARNIIMLLLLALLALPVIGIFHLRSARYVFMLAFPFTFLAAVFMVCVAESFRRYSVLVLTLFTAALLTGNVVKIFRIDPNAGFAADAVRKLAPYIRDVPKEQVLLIGTSRDLGRIARRTGISSLQYPYPVDDVIDLELLKQHFCDKYKTLILVYTNRPDGYSMLPEALFSIPKGKKEDRIYFYKVELSPSPVPDNSVIDRNGKNLFLNADLKQPMPPNAVDRIRTFFKDNPEVLKIVDRPDFFWPYAWPFDHAEDFFPQNGFDLSIDKMETGENAIHIKSLKRIPFFHPVPLPARKNYFLHLTLQFMEDSEVIASLHLNGAQGNQIDQEEIKVISGKAGEIRSFEISVYPGRLQRISEDDRKNGTILFFFALNHGDVRFSNFELLEI